VNLEIMAAKEEQKPRTLGGRPRKTRHRAEPGADRAFAVLEGRQCSVGCDLGPVRGLGRGRRQQQPALSDGHALKAILAAEPAEDLMRGER